jgi:hypothetical protein
MRWGEHEAHTTLPHFLFLQLANLDQASYVYCQHVVKVCPPNHVQTIDTPCA